MAGVMRRGRPPKTGRDEIVAAAVEVLAERGIARLTTREIASRMGISEGTIFYHFGDRKGLIKAVFDESLRPLLQFKTLPPEPPQNLDDLRAGIAYFTETVGNFLESGLDVLFATQADADLRTDIHAVMAENDYGPQHGLAAITGFIEDAQAAGFANPEADAGALAYLLLSSVFFRTTQPRLVGHDRGRVDATRTLDTVMLVLTPQSAGDDASAHSTSTSAPVARSPHSTSTTSARSRR